MQNSGKHPTYDTNQDRADYGSPKTADMEAFYQGGHQPEHQPVYDQQEKAECQEGDGKGNQDQ
jgi:hypothetical protein